MKRQILGVSRFPLIKVPFSTSLVGLENYFSGIRSYSLINEQLIYLVLVASFLH